MTEIITTTLGSQKLTKALAAHGLDDAAAAKVLGCDRSCVSRLRRGARRPRPDLMKRIQDAFDIHPGEWFEEASLAQRDAA